jgi:Xaa-Pro aminopeptidase
MRQIAWLLNIRGSDVDYNPVVTSYVVVTLEKAHFFVDERKLGGGDHASSLLEHFATDVVLHPYEEVERFLMFVTTQGKVLADPMQLNWRLYKALGASVVDKTSLLTLPKSIKNAVELKGIRECHIRDGAALTAFLCWLENAVAVNPGTLTEYDVTVKIEEFRRKAALHAYPSFPTIAGYASNGAIIHYKPEAASAATLFNGPESMFLLDSGAQYFDGTTDVTRTVHFGQPTEYMKMCYTLVLQVTPSMKVTAK